MSRSDGDEDALIVSLDPKEQAEECVSVSDLALAKRLQVSCLHLFAPGAGNNLIWSPAPSRWG